MKISLGRRLFFAILMLMMSMSVVCAERFSFDEFYNLVLSYLGEDEEGEALDLQDLELKLRRAYDNRVDKEWVQIVLSFLWISFVFSVVVTLLSLI